MARTDFWHSKTKLMMTALFAVSTLMLGMVAFHKVSADYVEDCKSNSIIKCGEPTPSAFISQVRANNDKQGHDDIQAVYSDFGLVPSDYSKFVSYARMGTAYQDGTIKVDGQTVATDAWSIGRQHFSYASPIALAGHTYYKASDQQVLLQNLSVMVLFNSKGVMQFAVMNACGNPVSGTKVVPKYSCDLLQKSSVQGEPNTYLFSTKASASDNAQVVKVVYTFGDGTSDTETSLTKQVKHTYTQPGNYTAKVTVYVSLPGKQTVTVTSANCQTQIYVPTPYQNCVELDPATIDEQKHQYQFTVSTSQGNGSVLESADYDFGDGNTVQGIKPATDTTVVEPHTYAQAGSYTITALAHFNTPFGEQTVSCSTQLNIKPKMCAINPSIPADSPECKPCKYNNQIPANSSACVPPSRPAPPSAPTATTKPLPNTGAGSIIALFAITVGLGTVGYRFIWKEQPARK